MEDNVFVDWEIAADKRSTQPRQEIAKHRHHEQRRIQFNACCRSTRETNADIHDVVNALKGYQLLGGSHVWVSKGLLEPARIQRKQVKPKKNSTEKADQTEGRCKFPKEQNKNKSRQNPIHQSTEQCNRVLTSSNRRNSARRRRQCSPQSIGPSQPAKIQPERKHERIRKEV